MIIFLPSPFYNHQFLIYSHNWLLIKISFKATCFIIITKEQIPREADKTAKDNNKILK